jgi:hypothetical protein
VVVVTGSDFVDVEVVVVVVVFLSLAGILNAGRLLDLCNASIFSLISSLICSSIDLVEVDGTETAAAGSRDEDSPLRDVTRVVVWSFRASLHLGSHCEGHMFLSVLRLQYCSNACADMSLHEG